MAPKYFVLIGLPSDHHLIPAAVQPKIAEGLAKIGAKFEAEGLDFHFFAASPESGLEGFKKHLQDKPADAVIIGMGVRGNPELTVFLEQIIDAARSVLPNVRILFNTTPETTIDAAKRY
eukprot:TRINITY_DN2874_c0_g1_i1.p1 TRINITY_DN2874_c0_g1~~TRINITY_DN2874_c0_g1_i1.p1  ORF type:complete len:119 (+),score=27.66 TRINITY_DN2874_c0_g1_i1:114-470(+)